VQGGALLHVSFSENNFLEVELPHLMRADELLYYISTVPHADRGLYSRWVAMHKIHTYPRSVNLPAAEAHKTSNAIVVVSRSDDIHGPPVYCKAMCWYPLSLNCPNGVGVPSQMPLQDIAHITSLVSRKKTFEDGAMLFR
jgi:hypothetical protein